ncbi:MAG: hypothetical protein ACJAXS_001989 [Colwellia sp.]|jgi:hypothetical protein
MLVRAVSKNTIEASKSSFNAIKRAPKSHDVDSESGRLPVSLKLPKTL